MVPETSVSTPDPEQDPIIEDQDLLAGASSRTTWPPDLVGDTSIQVNWQSGKDLKIHFSFLDSNFQTVSFQVSGRLTIFKSSGIPALDPAQSVAVTFQDEDTLTLSSTVLSPLFKSGQDTLGFNILIESNHWGKSFLVGFTYFKAALQFNDPAASLTTANSIFLDRVERYYRGACDATKILAQSSTISKSQLCFYIPGSSYYWPAKSDSIRLGPLPNGNYPLRLLRVDQAAGGLKGSEVEIYEILQRDQGGFKIFQLGKRILALHTDKVLNLRPTTQP
jgi:hypothetical protein